MDQKYFKKEIPDSFKKINLNLLPSGNFYIVFTLYLQLFILHLQLFMYHYIVLSIISNLERKYMGRYVEVFLPFYIKDLSIFRFLYLLGFWSQFPEDTEGRLSYKTK